MRLWFLFAVALFDRSQVAELTGASVGEITDELRRMEVKRGDFLHPVASDWEVVRAVSAQLKVLPDRILAKSASMDTTLLRRRLREAFAAGQIPWAEVDALPPPEKIVSAERKAVRHSTA